MKILLEESNSHAELRNCLPYVQSEGRFHIQKNLSLNPVVDQMNQVQIFLGNIIITTRLRSFGLL